MALPLSKTSIESVIHYVQLNSYILAEKKSPRSSRESGGGGGKVVHTVYLDSNSANPNEKEVPLKSSILRTHFHPQVNDILTVFPQSNSDIQWKH